MRKNKLSQVEAICFILICMINEIILNNSNQAITMVNNNPYVLIKEKINNHLVNINDILYIQNNTINISKDRLLFRKIELLNRRATLLSDIQFL